MLTKILNMETSVSWRFTSCTLLCMEQRFGGRFCLRFRSKRQKFPPKCHYISTNWHDITS